MASSIVKSAAQQVGNLLVEEAKSLYQLREKMENLQTELEWIECFLRDADTQQHQEKVICKWVSQVRDISYEAEDIIEKYLNGVSHHRRDGVRNALKWFSCILYTCDAWTLHNLGLEIDGLTIKLSDLTSRLKRYGIKIIRPTGGLEYNSVAMEERRTYSHPEETVVGLEEVVKKVVGELVNKDVKVAGISGTGGLGKTTLVRKVFKHKDIKDHFSDGCAWVYISKEFDKGKIFRQILDQLENDEEKKKKINNLQAEGLPGELHKLLQEKQCLVVLDDMWHEKDWRTLQPAFGSISTPTLPSKILFTTRNKKLIEYIDPYGDFGYLHLLEHLSEEDSWELLKKIALGSNGKKSLTSEGIRTAKAEFQDDDGVKREAGENREMEQLGKEMLKHCGGLPIAIVALGGILSQKKIISGWKDVQRNMSSYLMSDPKQGGGGANRLFQVLELSYHDLPFYLKPCFLYLGNFPEDYEISTERLYHLWEAEGFLVIEAAEGGSVYDVAEKYMNELVQRSMVQVGKCWPNGKIVTCRVHDVMRDMCLQKCKEVGFLHYIERREPDTTSTLPALSVEIKNLRRVALNDGKGEFLDKHFEHGERTVGVRSLLVFHDKKISSKVWKCFPLLRVLDLEGSGIYFIDGVGHLIHLRYLSLKWTQVQQLPACLYDLKYLETLDLRTIRMESKLRNKFGGMKKLRHLYLPESFEVEGSDEKLEFPRGVQMETLINFDPERCDTMVLMQMPNLRVFSIRGSYRFEEEKEVKMVLHAPVVKNEGQLINSLRLQMNGDVIQEPLILSLSYFDHLEIHRGELLMNNTVFPERLTQVEIYFCKIGVGVVLSLGNLTRLKSLLVDGAVDVPPHSFPIVGAGESRKLSVPPHSFPKLTQLRLMGQTELEEMEVEEGALPCLQSLKLSGFRMLKNLPQSLREVRLFKCVIDSELILALGELPHLKSLIIIDGAVVDVAGGSNKLSVSTGSFPQLTQLRLMGQTEMEESEFEEGALPCLQRLELSGCRRNLKNLPQSLTEVDLFKCVIDSELILSLGELPLLKSLHLECSGGGLGYMCRLQCKEVGFLNKPSFPSGSFPVLTKLRLDSVDEFEFGDAALPNLQSLVVFHCKKLSMKNFSSSLTEVEFHKCEIGDVLSSLGELPLLQILHLQYIEDKKSISFPPGSFPHLVELHLSWDSRSEEWSEWEAGDGALPNLQRLYLTNCKKVINIPNSLTQVSLWHCDIGERGVPLTLENFPSLQQLCLYSPIVDGKEATEISFSAGSFPHLTQLDIGWADELKKCKVRDGALPILQQLELVRCKNLKKIPRGLPPTVQIECENPCIKGIEKYNTCPYYFNDSDASRFKLTSCLHAKHLKEFLHLS